MQLLLAAASQSLHFSSGAACMEVGRNAFCDAGSRLDAARSVFGSIDELVGACTCVPARPGAKTATQKANRRSQRACLISGCVDIDGPNCMTTISWQLLYMTTPTFNISYFTKESALCELSKITHIEQHMEDVFILTYK
jgi:hypothetical protein